MLLSRSFVGGVIAFACVAGSAPASDSLQEIGLRSFSVDEFVKARCSQNSAETFMEWGGSVFAQRPGERQRLLFRVVGMNVARCLRRAAGGWELVSREVQLYLDPVTGARIDRWRNPWSGEDLPVVHVANAPVQNVLHDVPFEATVANGIATFATDIPLTYPNPLASDGRFAPFSSEPTYQAIEMFRYMVPLSEIEAVPEPSARSVSFSWSRVGPWLPWMKMAGAPGQLVYSTAGSRVSGYAALSPLLREVIESRIPAYRNAPTCWLATSNETSWTYFGRHFERYLAGELFPVPEPVQEEVCR